MVNRCRLKVTLHAHDVSSIKLGALIDVRTARLGARHCQRVLPSSQGVDRVVLAEAFAPLVVGVVRHRKGALGAPRGRRASGGVIEFGGACHSA